MIDERAFIERVESAHTDEFIRILRRPTMDEERALRVYFGDEHYNELHLQTTQTTATRGERASKGNVVVAHGIMGGELTVYRSQGGEQQIWLQLLRLIIGGAGWLRFNPEGVSLFDVRPTGILKKWYGKMLVGLAKEWTVRDFYYDWRRDIRESAKDLHRKINEWFGDEAPVHIVAHSMGGLVARSFIKLFPQRWKSMWDSRNNGARGGRLIMLGTPNHGSFSVPQIATGLNSSVRRLEKADLKHSLPELLEIVNSFIGSYQMLPSPLEMPEMEPLYRSSTYGSFGVPQNRLDRARKFHEWLSDVVDGERMLYIAGYDQLTVVDIKDMSLIGEADGYASNYLGDGTVPHRLGFLKEKDGSRIATYFVFAEHGALPNNSEVIEATRQLMEKNACSLPQKIPAGARVPAQAVISSEAAQIERGQQMLDELRLKALLERIQPRARAADSGVATPLTSVEREAEEIILQPFLASGTSRKTLSFQAEPTLERKAPEKTEPVATSVPTIQITLVRGSIQSIDNLKVDNGTPDAIAVGHYLGVKPQAAEKALDIEISSSLPGRVDAPRKSGDTVPDESDLLITQFTERGIVRGELGQPFFMNDPRHQERLIVLAGMGIPGRFGEPELTVLVRELCWALGRSGKTHLATVLIGAGTGNLGIFDAVRGWMRGIRRVLIGSVGDEMRVLKRVTFVEFDPRNVEAIDAALKEEAKSARSDIAITYSAWPAERLEAIRKDALAWEQEALKKEWEARQSGRGRAVNQQIPIRMTVGLDQKTYTFAAITENAAIPQRNIVVDPRLIEQASAKLASADDPAEQVRSGQLLEQLLMPDDIRASIYTDAPLVLMLDATTARIHWEMMVTTDRRLKGVESSATGGQSALTIDPNAFLGLSRGLTRQLRTSFAPPPEPPPPPRRVLRVLVVADPADDAPLPGAQAEGEEVASLFEKFNEVYRDRSESRVKVKRLFGPYEAMRINVLSELMLVPYDVLHFAGHCVYDEKDPANSGWIFSARNDERLTANELNRIDRIPKFIFSNACESGITPDRSELGSPHLAPSFAEAFFARGVSNFVCTAWPVDDLAARDFATRLYSGLLGLRRMGEPEAMHVAMKEARVAIATQQDAGRGGLRTWGAYQHYGNPYFRFFDPTTILRTPSASKSGTNPPTPLSSVPKATAKPHRPGKKAQKKQ